MSIIERALHKTQQVPKAAAMAAAPAVVEDPAAAPAGIRGPTRSVEIDFDRMRAFGRIPAVGSQRRLDEELRRIKWPLLAAISGKSKAEPVRNKVILITSAMPSEGKSFTALNLALNIARDRDTRVILIDGDVARPALTPAFGLNDSKGLNDVLEDPAMDLEQVLYVTNVDGLTFLPAGKWHDQSPELFAGPRMSQLLSELSRRVGNGVVILDSPPLLATNEAQVTTRYVGQVLMVVRADFTEHRAVADALALVDTETPVSAVLNRVEPSLVSKYYGQYEYGDGKYYDSERSKKQGKMP